MFAHDRCFTDGALPESRIYRGDIVFQQLYRALYDAFYKIKHDLEQGRRVCRRLASDKRTDTYRRQL